MLKKAAALFLVCGSIALWVGCTTTSSRYLYAAIPAASEIIAYREDPNSGVLTPLTVSPILAGEEVQSLVIHPTKPYLYAANPGATPLGNISSFKISSSGVITEQGSRTNAGSVPSILAIDAAGAYLYAGNSGSEDISVFSIDSGTGLLRPVLQTSGTTAPIGLIPSNMQISGNFLFVTGEGSNTGYIEVFPVSNGVLGTPVPGSPFLTGNNPFGLAINSSGTFLYTGNKRDSTISEFAINADGSLMQLPKSPVGQSYSAPVSLWIDKTGKYLYVANQGSTNLSAYNIESDGGLDLLATSPFATATNPSFIAGDVSGKFLFVANQGSATSIESFALDPGTGTLTEVQTYKISGGTATSIAITPTQ
jgi:6-phosphogluconolactonase